MEIKITFFAHGATVDNELGLATGWWGGELSEAGRRQAKELGKLLVNKNFDAVFCSDLKRAADSANLAFGDKYKIIVDKRLRECDYGDLTGKPFGGIENHLADYIDRPFPNGESLKGVEKRISEFLDFLKQNYDNKSIAIVSHQAPQLALEVLLNGKTWGRAIVTDWRKTKSWRVDWEYIMKGN